MKKAKLKAAQKGILFFDGVVSYGSDDGKRIVDVAERKNFEGLIETTSSQEWDAFQSLTPNLSFFNLSKSSRIILTRCSVPNVCSYSLSVFCQELEFHENMSFHRKSRLKWTKEVPKPFLFL